MAGQQYLFRVINYASVPGQPFTLSLTSYQGELVETPRLIEAWTLTCEVDGAVVEQVPVVVDRGQRVVVDLDVCGPDEAPGRGPKVPKPPRGR